jgi:hypothetical protein
MQDEMTQDQDLLEGPDLYAIIKDTCAVTGTLDYDQIIIRLTKNTSPEAAVRDCLGLDEFTPEALLRHLIDDLLSPEDRLIYQFGLSPEVAEAVAAMIKAYQARDAAEETFIETIESDVNAACRQIWNETQTDNPTTAVQAMMDSLLGEAWLAAGMGQLMVFLRGHFEDCYASFLAEQQRGDGT